MSRITVRRRRLGPLGRTTRTTSTTRAARLARPVRPRVVGQLVLYLKLTRTQLQFDVERQPLNPILWAGPSIYSRYGLTPTDRRLQTSLPATYGSGCSFVSTDGSVLFTCGGYSAVYSPSHMGYGRRIGPVFFYLKGPDEEMSSERVRTISLSAISHLGNGPEVVKKIQRAVRQFNLERHEFFRATMKPVKVAAREGWDIAQ